MRYLTSCCTSCLRFCHLKMIFRAPHQDDKVSPKSIKVWGCFKTLSKSICQWAYFSGNSNLQASLVAQTVKNQLALQETQVQSPEEGNGYPLQYSCLENSMEEPVNYSPRGRRVGHDWGMNMHRRFIIAEHKPYFAMATSSGHHLIQMTKAPPGVRQ